MSPGSYAILHCVDCMNYTVGAPSEQEARERLSRHWLERCPIRKAPSERESVMTTSKEVGRALVTIEAMKLTRANVFEIMAWLRHNDIFSTVANARISPQADPPDEIRLHIQGRDRAPRTVAAEGDYVLKTMRGDFDSVSPENFEAALAKWSEAK